MNTETFIKSWIKNPRKIKLKNYAADKDSIKYTGWISGNKPYNFEKRTEKEKIETILYYYDNKYYGTDILAIVRDKKIIGNASRLKFCESWFNRTVKTPQKAMFESNISMIPFNAIEEAGLKVENIHVLEQGKQEDILAPIITYKYGYMREEDARDTIMSKKKMSNNKEYIVLNQKKKINNQYEVDVIIKKNLEKRHFVGALLLECEGKHFLFDIDRNEIKHYRFNAFITELPEDCKTIKEAYSSLIPFEARRKKYKRQGEWFFIKTKDKIRKNLKVKNKPSPSDFGLYYYEYSLDSKRNNEQTEPITGEDLSYYKLDKKGDKKSRIKLNKYNKEYRLWLESLKRYGLYTKNGNLRSDNNRPNTVDELYQKKDKKYVKGWVKHSGREHEPLFLKEWHEVYPNRAIKSFQISGDID